MYKKNATKNYPIKNDQNGLAKKKIKQDGRLSPIVRDDPKYIGKVWTYVCVIFIPKQCKLLC